MRKSCSVSPGRARIVSAPGAHVVELLVVRHDGVIVDDQVHPQLAQGVALDIVEDVVAQQRVLAAVHLGMHAGEALAGTVVVHHEVMDAEDLLMRQDELGRWTAPAPRLAGSPSSGLMVSFADGPAGPEDEQRDQQADPAVDLPV